MVGLGRKGCRNLGFRDLDSRSFLVHADVHYIVHCDIHTANDWGGGGSGRPEGVTAAATTHTVYVAVDGLDVSGDGTVGHPFRSIGRAQAAIHAVGPFGIVLFSFFTPRCVPVWCGQ